MAKNKAKKYFGSVDEWKKLAKQDNIDLISNSHSMGTACPNVNLWNESRKTHCI